MKRKTIIFIILLSLLVLGGLFSIAPVLAQAPPAGHRFFMKILGGGSSANYRQVRVHIEWQEKGVTQKKDYYTIIKDLSK